MSRAGPELPILHLGLWALSLVRRARLVSTLEPLAVPLGEAAGLVAPLGSDRGGMVVNAEGLDADGARRPARWSLCAEAGAGPTPRRPRRRRSCAPCWTIDWANSAPRPASAALDLDAILRELRDLPIRTARESQRLDAPGLFPACWTAPWPIRCRRSSATPAPGLRPVTPDRTGPSAAGAPGLPRPGPSPPGPAASPAGTRRR